MTRNGIATKVDLAAMSIDGAREVCATWAQIQHDWHLPPIELMTDVMEDEYLGFGKGGRIRLNKSIFNKKAAEKIQKEYKDATSGGLAIIEKRISDWKKRSEVWQGYIDIAEQRGDEVSARSYRKTKKGFDNIVSKYEKLKNKWLNEGHTRHNVLLSEKTMIRNVVQHESGHVLDDRFLGGLNGDLYLLKDKLSADEIKLMNKEIVELFKKYETNCGWLSFYGARERKEFLSECMVLYSERGGEGLPKDVKAWFDKLRDMSSR